MTAQTPKINAVVFRLDEVRNDPALVTQGHRKQVVTSLYPSMEKPVEEVEWKPSIPPANCPVLVMKDTESAVFNENAKQDRHYHAKATEIYLVIEGCMHICVETDLYEIEAGDMIVVNPNAWHEVKPNGNNFLCRVITVNCQGVADKYT